MSHVIAQIGAQKKRRSPFQIEFISNDALEISQQLDRVIDEINNFPDTSSECWKISPIGMVTCLENATRWAVKTLIDHGEPFASNARSIKIRTFSVEDIMAMIGEKISGGELVAHLIPVNRMGDITKNISALLGHDKNGKPRDFWDELKKAKVYDSSVYDATEVDDETIPFLLSDASSVYIAVEYIFELRHIVVHEVISPDRLKIEKIKLAVPKVRAFIHAMLNFVNEEISPGYTSMTQLAMTEASRVELEKADAELGSTMANLEKLIDEDKRMALRESEKKWEEYVMAELNFFTNPFGDGSGAPMIANGFTTRLLRSRTDHLKNHIDNLRIWDEEAAGTVK